MNTDKIESTIPTKTKLHTLVSSLFEVNLQDAEGKAIIIEIHELFHELTGISGYNKEADYQKAVVADKGLAISINHTALCLKDHKRTIHFVKAIHSAIRQKQQALPGKTIQVFYAGCGPYAPFCTLVAPLFEAEEVQFTLLEINQLSLGKAEDLIYSFGLENYVADYRQADAVTYQIPPSDNFDILISETLDAALHRESFVPILLNLLPQVQEDTILIPQNIILKACLIRKEDFPTGNCDVRNPNVKYPEYFIGEVFNVKNDLAPFLAQKQKPSVFPTKQFRIGKDIATDLMVVYTEVQILDDFWLTRGEGLLTEPSLKEVEKKADTMVDIKFTYFTAPDVELKFEFDLLHS